MFSTDVRAKALIEYSDQSESDDLDETFEVEDDTQTEFVIPEDMTALNSEELTELHNQALGLFETQYGDGTGLSEDDLEVLASLTEGIEALNAEIAARAEAEEQRTQQASELAARIRPEETASADTDDEDENEEDEDEEDTDDGAAGTETAAARKEVRVNLSSVRSRRPAPAPRTGDGEPASMRDVVRVADVPGFNSGEGLDWDGVGRAVDRRLAGFNPSQYSQAARSGRHIREQHGVLSIDRNLPRELQVQNDDPGHVEQVLAHATDQSRLPGNSLVASGGWGAPHQNVYDFLELESTDGLLSAPEIGITRGGISWTMGPDFSEIFEGTGFEFTEEDDVEGNYDGEGGDKPCYTVGDVPFLSERLRVAGLCITAGLLQQRGFPEIIARTVRGALVAHEHKMSQRKINAIVAGSTEVTMPTGQVGAIAPLLTSIELQVEHYRYVHRLSRNTTLEAVFPFWVRGAVRSDLARRLGVDLISVPDSRVDQWFRDAGVSPQFVYNWQDMTGEPGTVTAWPETVDFLLYHAGTWVFGGADVITMDTIYDSVLLGQNNYTALFTEEAWLPMKRFPDSRQITVPLSAAGATHAGVLINHDGTASTAGD